MVEGEPFGGRPVEGDRAAVEHDDALARALDQLYEWAVIEPELEGLYSTRRVVGGPITFVKRMVARSLRQYLGQMIAQQTRFNLQLTVYVARLADRVDELERRAKP